MAEVMKHQAGTCPDLETIAAYLDGTLSDRERARVTEHLAGCEECYAVFRESAQTHVEEVGGDRVVSMRTWRDRVTRPRVLWSSAAAAVALAASIVLVVRTGIMAPPTDDYMTALVAAVGTERPAEARLAGGFAYAPLRGALRSGASNSIVSPDVRIAAARIEKAAAVRRTPEMLHAVGVSAIVTHEVARAVSVLEQAVEDPSADASAWSDLAAAYLARAARDGAHVDLEKALAAADRALKIDSPFAPALFNRALALDHLLLQADARAAWQDYLRVDTASGWADEARAHLNPKP